MASAIAQLLLLLGLNFATTAEAGNLVYSAVGSDKFMHAGYGMCSTSLIYPKWSSPTFQCSYQNTSDVPGLDPRQTCLKKCVESFGIVQGIYLASGQCGCCPAWDGNTIQTGWSNYHLYKMSADIVAQMVPLPVPAPTPPKPSWYGDSSMFEFLGNGHCSKWSRYPGIECKYANTTGSGVQNSDQTDVTRLSSCAQMCVNGLAPLEVKGAYLADGRCGCCLASAADGEEWAGQKESGYPDYYLYKFTRSTAEVFFV